MSALDSVVWPSLYCEPNVHLMRFNSRDVMCRASLRGVQLLSKLDAVYLVDSRGQRVLLNKPHVTRTFGGPRKVWMHVTGTVVNIDYPEAVLVDTLSVDDFRNLILNVFRVDRDYWEEYDLPWLKSRVKEARTHRELIECFNAHEAV